MSTKLTLSLNEQTIDKAKAWAKIHHTSLSGLVENYFESLVAKNSDISLVSPKTRALSGLFKKYDEGFSYKELVHKYKTDAQ
ncbi:MAG: DUF6364 family protein [Mariprofundus sp.]